MAMKTYMIKNHIRATIKCNLVAWQVGPRAHNKIFFSFLLNCLKFLFLLLASRIYKYFFWAFKQYQYQWSSVDLESWHPELIMPAAHGAGPETGKYHILHVDQRPLYREAGDGLHKCQHLVPRTGKSTLRLCYYLNNIVRPFGTI